MEHLKTALIIFMLSAFLTIPIAYSQENLILNPSLEQGVGSPNNWYAGANAYWSNEGHKGIHSIGLNPTSSSGDWRSEHFNISANGKYYFEFWVKGDYSSGEFYVYVRWFRDASASNFISQTPFRIMGSYSDWVCVNDTLTAPSDAMTCDIFYRAEGTSTGNILVDDFLMYQIVEPESTVKQWFYELFFGSAKWLTLTVTLAIIIAIATWNGYAGIIFMPLTVFLSVWYFQNVPASSDFTWGAIIMMVSTIYILAMAIRKASSSRS